MTSRIPAPPPRKPSSPDDAARRLRPSTPRRLIRAVTKPEAAEATSRTPPWLKEAETLLRRPTEGSDEHLEDETADLGRVSRFKDALASAQQREGVEHTTRHKPARRKLEPGQSSVRFSPVPPPSLTPAASPQTTSPTPSLPPEPEPQQQDRPQEQPQEPPPPPPPPSRPPPQPSFASKGVCVAVLLTASVMWCSWRPASISPPLPPPSAASAWPAAPAAPAERASPFHWLWRGRLPAPRWPPWPPPPSPAQRDRLQRCASAQREGSPPLPVPTPALCPPAPSQRHARRDCGRGTAARGGLGRRAADRDGSASRHWSAAARGALVWLALGAAGRAAPLRLVACAGRVGRARQVAADKGAGARAQGHAVGRDAVRVASTLVVLAPRRPPPPAPTR